MLVGWWLWRWLTRLGVRPYWSADGTRCSGSPGLSTSFTVAARSRRCSGGRCGLCDGLGAVAGRRYEPLRCAASCELRAAAPRCSGLVAPSGTRGLGNPAAVKRF